MFYDPKVDQDIQAYNASHPGQNNNQPSSDQGTITTGKPATFSDHVRNTVIPFDAGVIKGVGAGLHVLKQAGADLDQLGLKAGIFDAGAVANRADASKAIVDSFDKGSNLGYNEGYLENSTAAQVGKMLPVLLGGESQAAKIMGLQAMGDVSQMVDKMKDNGVQFHNGSDRLFIYGSGLISYGLGKSVVGTVLSKIGGQPLVNEVTASIAADATKELASLPANATAADIAEYYTGKALTFTQKFQEIGLGALKAYPKIATEFAGANLLGSGLKATSNAISGNNPLGDVTGDEIAKDVSSPIYNGGNPAHGDPLQFLQNLITTPAAGFSMLHAGASAGMLFDKSPYVNPVVESLQKDGSPENVQAIKDQLGQLGEQKGWNKTDIYQTQGKVDEIADVVKTIPKDLKPGKFNEAVSLILGRRQLEGVLESAEAKSPNLDPAFMQDADKFKNLVTAKIEQANDNLNELVTDKSYRYFQKEGKFYKQKLNEEPIEITPERAELEDYEKEAKKKNSAGLGGGQPEQPAEPLKPQSPSGAPAVDTSMLDDLDNELDNFKQTGSTEKPESVIKSPESEIKQPESKIKPQTIDYDKLSDDEKLQFVKQKYGGVNHDSDLENKSIFEKQRDRVLAAIKTGEKDAVLEADSYTKYGIDKAHETGIDEVYNAVLSKNGIIQPEKPAGESEPSAAVQKNDEEKKLDEIVAANPGRIIKATLPKTESNEKTTPNTGTEATPAETPEPTTAESKETPAKAANEEAGHTEVEKPYYITLPGDKDGQVEHEEIEGKPFPNDHGLDLFSHKIGDNGVGISEGSTGLSIAKGHTMEEATEKANNILSKKTPDEMQAIIKAKHENGLQSPRGIIKPESKDQSTQNTEAVIAKATATVREAEATVRGSAEHPGILDAVNESLDEIDKEIADLSKAKTPEHGLKEGDKVIYDGRPYTVDNVDKTGAVFKNEENGLLEVSSTHDHLNKKMAEGKLTMAGEPEPEPTNEPPKDDKKAKREQYADDLKKAKKAFMDTFNKALSGINPETIEKGIKLLAVYAKIGVHDFGEIVKDLYEDLGEKARDIFDGLKAAYGAFATSEEATDEQLDQMTNLRDVRKAKFEDYIPKTENNGTGSESNTLEENTPPVDERKPAAGTPNAVGNKPVEELPAAKDDRGGEAGNEVKRGNAKNDTARGGQSGSGNDTGTGAGRAKRGSVESGNGSAVPENTSKRVIAPEDQNHVIGKGDTLVPAGAVGKFNANVDALFLLKKLEAEDRNPTPDEKKTLAQFVGWGGLAKYLDTPNKPDNSAIATVINGKRDTFYDNRYNRQTLDFTEQGPLDLSKYNSFDDLLNDVRKQLVNSGYSITPDALRAPLLKSLLTNEEYSAAQNSTINAHYTERAVINNMWDISTKMGFKGGRVLESSAGIGHFFGLMPADLRNKTSLQSYELDSITGRILKKLYPQSSTTISGFENARVPQNSIDLAIGNVPFAASAPYDKNFPDLSKFSMHNYFIAKNLKLLKPGGMAVMITSSSTMDSPSSGKFRDWVTSPEGGNSYLVGAIRLPSNAFSENAGTQVTTDMLVFQKKGQVVNTNLEQPFRYTKYLSTGKDDKGNDVDLHINEYYIEHPEQMLGTMMTAHEAGTGGLYGGDSATLKAPEGQNINKELNKASEIFPKDIAGNKTEPDEVKSEPITAIDKKEGSVFEKNGKIYKVQDGDASQIKLEPKQVIIAKAYVDLKEGLLNLISLEQSDVNAEANIEAQRKELNKNYDDFVKKHGNINGRNTTFLSDSDIDFPIVSSLENIARSIDDKTSRIIQTITKGEILNKRINFPRIEPTAATDIKDAINISLNYRTGLDINYMAKMLGEDPDEVRQRLLKDELAYENPDTGILETPEEYLSGFVRDKLRKAEIAASNDPVYLKNVAELKKIIPEDIPSSLISYSLGSSWIPSHVYEGYAKEIFGADLNIKYLPAAGKYLVTKGYGSSSAAVHNTYAAGGMDGIAILDATLNNKQIIVTDTVEDGEGKKRQVKNPEKTAAAQGMQQQLQDEFENYIRGNEDVQQETERIYNDVFNGQVLRNYRIPDFKHYPGASTAITLRDHQKRAVSRNLAECTLNAHEVGSGKTYTIITTVMEMRRLGTARRPLIGVQNSTLGDFVADFKRLYPSAKILAPTEREMQADGRKKLFAKIATGDWDAIILPHSQVTMIPDDPERQKAYIMEQIQEMKDTIASISDPRERRKMEYEVKGLLAEIDKLDGIEPEESTSRGGKSTAKKIGAASLKIEAAMQKALDRKVDNIFNFEQLGIDAMQMDEAHKYKRLGFQTSMKNIKGIDTSKSQRSQSILLKARWIQEKTGGKNVSFFTGTPISNTMAEAWTMLKYLRPDILEHMGIQYFDQFAKTFGQVIPSLEQTGGGTFKVQSRFAKFQNLPEFINAFRAMTDVVLTSDVKEFQNTDTIPKLKNGKFTQVVIPQSPELKTQINEFKRVLEWFDKLTGKEKKKNSHVPLVIFNKAKQASIDLRLLDPTNVDSPQSKVNQAIDNAYNIYKENADKKGVQMIFSDMYQSPEPKNKYLDEDGYVVNPAYGKDRFNLFEDIKKKLVAKGIPADQIVIFTEAKYDKAERKKAVFADANSGKIRFLLGTTEKMGVGVNAQQKLVALHHLDAPARPMDFEQRNGRIIRQGNENKEVNVLTYGVEKTLDSSAFQRLSTKQKFINQIMKGQNLERVTEDPADEAQMTFDEMMAHLSDSPFAMQKLLVDNKLRSEVMKQQNFNQKVIRTNRILRDTENDLKRDKSKLADQIKYADIVRKHFPDQNITSLNIHGQPEVTEKFGEVADGYVKKLIDKYNSSPTLHAKGGFDINGVRVELEVNNNERMSKATNLFVNTPQLGYTIPELGLIGEHYKEFGYDIPSNTGTGLLSSIRRKIDGVLVDPATTQGYINKDEKDIEQLKKDAQAKFDDSKMKELTDESEALKAKMLAESKKPDPDDTPEGGQSNIDYIKDQSNIQPALNFLDSMKAKNDGRFMSTIVPIPPAVWNAAIDVMKNVLKATNSTQKAIRVAGKYIVDKGGSEAQSKDFESTMTDKMANTNAGKVNNLPDTEEGQTEEKMVKSATELQSKLSSQELSPDEKTFSKLDVKAMNKKELHRYIEVASVLSVDPQGVLTKDVTDVMDRVNNRINPRSGTAVPPTPPITPPGGNDNLMDDDDEPRKRIPKKDKLPMDSVEQMPEQTDADGKPEQKDNYSAFGRFKDIRVRNLEQLKKYGEDMGNMDALRQVRQYATSKSQSSIVMKTATDRIIKAVGKAGWDLLRQALVESRLRGIQQRWENWATQIKKTSDNDLDDLFEDGKNSMMYDIISRLDGYEGDPKPEQTILGLLSNDQYDDVREYMSDMFYNAADNVAYYDKLSNGQTFDDMVTDGAFNDPKMEEALQAYKSLMAKPFEESHAANEGIFSDALGPLDTYYPLVPTGSDKHYVVTPGNNKYKAPENPNNKFATGQGNHYSTELSDLSYKLANAIRTSNKANAIKALENAGLIAKVSKDSPDTGGIMINGEEYTAQKVLVQDSRLITHNGKTVSLPARYVLMPKWLYREVKPIFEDSGDLHDDFSLFGRINNLGVKLMLGGPIEATSHSYRLLGGIVNSMPYMQEWAYKNGILGHAGGLVLNNPFVKTFAGLGQILFSDISSDEAMTTIQEMAKLGIIPEKTWQKTWSKEFAELTGAKKVPIWDFSPILYGKNSIDLKSRVLLYRLTKAMNPNATPEQIVTMQNELGNYTMSLQGDLEKYVKKHGLAPFYSFGGAIYRSGIKSVFGASSLPLTRPSLKEAFTTKMGAEQMAKLSAYKMAQLLSAGIVGLLTYWAFTYHAQTDKWPWEDKHSKLLKIPFPKGAVNPVTKKMFADRKTGEMPDIDFSFFNPFINRGIRAIGAPKAYETAELGGTAGQDVEAGMIQAINTNLSPYTSSPAIQMGVTALTGDAPYITGIRDRYAGTPGIGFFRKVNTFSPGLQIPANMAVAAAGLNPIIDYGLSPLTKALKYKYVKEDQDIYSAGQSVIGTILPHLTSPHGSDKFKEQAIEKQQKAIKTSMKKEKEKQHKH